MNKYDQLDKWVEGDSIHDTENDECCPDFSCCTGKPVDKDIRERFAKAYYDNDQETVHEMLMMFLAEMIQEKYKNRVAVIIG